MTQKFDIEVMRPVLPDANALAAYLQQIDQTGWYANRGPLTKELEQRLADHFGVERHRLVTTSSCTSGLQMAYLTARQPGARYVLTPAWTFAAAPLAAMAAGLTPFFLDVDPDSQQLTPETAKAALRRLGADTVAAVSPVSPQGAPVDMEGWAAFQADTGCRVVHDAAAAFISVQASDIVSCVSLHATKLLPAGEGGFVHLRLGAPDSLGALAGFAAASGWRRMHPSAGAGGVCLAIFRSRNAGGWCTPATSISRCRRSTASIRAQKPCMRAMMRTRMSLWKRSLWAAARWR